MASEVQRPIPSLCKSFEGGILGLKKISLRGGQYYLPEKVKFRTVEDMEEYEVSLPHQCNAGNLWCQSQFVQFGVKSILIVEHHPSAMASSAI